MEICKVLQSYTKCFKVWPNDSDQFFTFKTCVARLVEWEKILLLINVPDVRDDIGQTISWCKWGIYDDASLATCHWSFQRTSSHTKWQTIILICAVKRDVFVKIIKELHTGLGDEEISGQSYKAPSIVNYNSRVVIWGIFKSGMTLES